MNVAISSPDRIAGAELSGFTELVVVIAPASCDMKRSSERSPPRPLREAAIACFQSEAACSFGDAMLTLGDNQCGPQSQSPCAGRGIVLVLPARFFRLGSFGPASRGTGKAGKVLSRALAAKEPCPEQSTPGWGSSWRTAVDDDQGHSGW
jgi:hypothetical protein